MRTTPHRPAGRRACEKLTSARCRASACSRSGRVFLRDPGVDDGPLSVARREPADAHRRGCLRPGACDEQWGAPTRMVDFFDVKGDLEALVRRSSSRSSPRRIPRCIRAVRPRVLVDGEPAGWIGELHPQWLAKYELPQPPVLFELEADALHGGAAARDPRFRRGSPSVRAGHRHGVRRRDFRPGRSGHNSGREAADRASASRVFGLYRGPGLPAGTKSLAFRVVMQDTARTLTDAEADAARDAAGSAARPQILRRLRTKATRGAAS